MDEFIKLLNQQYELDEYKIKEHNVVFRIHSMENSIVCPYCGTISTRTHSTYQREIQDLPIQDKQVILLVSTRKIFCDNEKCTHKTFSEKHPFVTTKGKKTNRLIDNILNTSTQLSSLSASRLLKSENINIGKSSICNLLKKNAYNCG